MMHSSGTTGSAAIIERYDGLVTRLAERYGPYSQAVVFVRYEQLLAARTMLLSHDPDSPLCQHVAALVNDIQKLYRMSAPDPEPTPWRRVIRDDPPLIEYDRKHFDSRYRDAARAVAEEIEVVTGGCAFGRLRPRQSYMYVITDAGELRIWSRPFPLRELVFGRSRSTVDDIPVAHPMLVPERLRVSAAGEIVLIGTDRVRMVVANTKSGHFRPPPASTAVVREHCTRLFDLDPSDVDVFALFTAADTTPSIDRRST